MNRNPWVLVICIAVGAVAAVDILSSAKIALIGLSVGAVVLGYRLLLVALLKRDSSKFQVKDGDSYIYWEREDPKPPP
ncbi:MAG: hypothetical protein QOE90_2553 [Thermoplasmata archaeon]|jgi:polysaccharide pyruvyl transferase WcaK-like protein|nr:hypothetical protein [Thermoplasmata archaeon]